MKLHTLFFSLLMFAISCRPSSQDSEAKVINKNQMNGITRFTSDHTLYQAEFLDAKGNKVESQKATHHCWYSLNLANNSRTAYLDHPLAVTGYPNDDDRWANYNASGTSINGECASQAVRRDVRTHLLDGGKSDLSFKQGDNTQICWDAVMTGLRDTTSAFQNEKVACPDKNSVIFKR